nr:MAG TPA: hypothetical protein [Bacteriophage sp.]
MEIARILQDVLAVCGGISIIGGAVTVVHKWIAPAIKLNERVEVLEDHDRKDFETLKRISERDSLILEVLLTMLDNQIVGDNTEQLKKTKEKLTAYLAQNQK